MLSQWRAEQFLVWLVSQRGNVCRDTYTYVTRGMEGVKAGSWCWPAGFLVTVRQLAGQDIE